MTLRSTTEAIHFRWPGNVEAENNGFPFRLANYKTIVAYEKRLYPLCQLLRSLAIEHGLSEIQLENHLLTQRFQAAVRFL